MNAQLTIKFKLTGTAIYEFEQAVQHRISFIILKYCTPHVPADCFYR
jgi:hypothetical protein